VPELAALHAEPFADASQIPTQLLSNKARNTPMLVCLSGDGGDELFGGYSRYGQIAALWNRWHKLPDSSQRLIAASTEMVDQALARLSSGSMHLRGPLRDWASHLLDSQRLEQQQLLRSKPIERCWESHLEGRSDQSTRLWPVLMLQAWLDQWMST